MAKETEVKKIPQADYSLLDIIELYDGCVIQFSDKFRNILGKKMSGFLDLFGEWRNRDQSNLKAIQETLQKTNEITQQNFGVTVPELENSMKKLREIYIKARRGGGNHQDNINNIVKKLGCDYAPYIPRELKAVTKPYKERTQDLLDSTSKK